MSCSFLNRDFAGVHTQRSTFSLPHSRTSSFEPKTVTRIGWDLKKVTRQQVGRMHSLPLLPYVILGAAHRKKTSKYCLFVGRTWCFKQKHTRPGAISTKADDVAILLLIILKVRGTSSNNSRSSSTTTTRGSNLSDKECGNHAWVHPSLY
jgi:hypothetical protein